MSFQWSFCSPFPSGVEGQLDPSRLLQSGEYFMESENLGCNWPIEHFLSFFVWFLVQCHIWFLRKASLVSWILGDRLSPHIAPLLPPSPTHQALQEEPRHIHQGPGKCISFPLDGTVAITRVYSIIQQLKVDIFMQLLRSPMQQKRSPSPRWNLINSNPSTFKNPL